MNNMEILAVVLAAGALIFGVCNFIFPRKSTGKLIETAASGLKAVNGAVDAVMQIAPGIPYIGIVDKIIDYAQIGVEKAEQLYKADQISADARKAEAVQLVKDCLTALNIEITPDVEKLIDGSVEAAVFTLPKTSGKQVKNSIENQGITVNVAPQEIAQRMRDAVKAAVQSEFTGTADQENSTAPAETAAQESDTAAPEAPEETQSAEPVAPAAIDKEGLASVAKALTAGIILLNNALSTTAQADNDALIASIPTAAPAQEAASSTADQIEAPQGCAETPAQ